MIKKLWESDGGIMDSIEVRARITEFEGEYHLEILSRNLSFCKRLKNAFNYLFKNAEVIKSLIPLSEDDMGQLSNLKKG